MINKHMHICRKHSLFAVLVLIISLVTPLLYSRFASAQTSGSWVNAGTISVGGETYIDTNPLDATLQYTLGGQVGDCIGGILFLGVNNLNNTGNLERATLIKTTVNTLNNQCSSSREELVLSNTPNAQIVFAWVDSATIESVITADEYPGLVRGALWKKLPGESVFAHDTEGTCRSSLTTSGQTVSVTFRAFIDVDIDDIRGCQESSTRTFGVTNQTAASLAEGTGTPQNTNPEEVAEGPIAGSCLDNEGAFVFFICEILDLANSTVNTLDNAIRGAMEVKPEYYTDGRIEDAWRSIRNVAYILLIPIMLVMVIGTALGFSFVDAYTVKRAMPRLFAAIIFMVLSFDIARIMIEVTTAVGNGVAGLLASPFGGADNLTLTNIFSPGTGDGAGLFATGVLGGIAAVGAGAIGLGIIASYMFIAAISLIVIFALLTMREMIILLLMIVAPLAILAWIFPGNDKMWKLWWNSFSKLLFIYPIIAALLIMGRIFAFIMANVNADGTDAIFITLAKLVAYIGPFFLIPAAFKFAGGAFANLAGMVNSREKGLFDRQRKYRGEKRKELAHKGRAGDRFGNMVGLRRFNTAVGRGFAAKDAGLSSLRKGGIAAQYSKNTEAAAAEYAEKNADFKAIAADDTVLRAADFHSETDIRRSLIDSGDQRFQNADTLNRTVRLIQQAKKGAGEESFAKASLLAKAKTGTYYENFADMAEDINRVYGDDRQGAGSALIAMRGASMNAGRVDLGGFGAGTGLRNLQMLHDGVNIQYDSTGVETGRTSWNAQNAQAAVTNNILDSQAAGTIAHSSMKEGYLERNVIPVMQQRIQAAFDSGDHDAYMRELAQAENLHQALKATKPALAGMFGDQVMAYDVGARRPVSAQEEATAQASNAGLRQGEQGPVIAGAGTVRRGTYQYADDPRYQNYSRQFYAAEQQMRNQQPQNNQGPTTAAIPPVTPDIR